MGANVLPGELVGLNTPFAAVLPELVEIARRNAADDALPGCVETLTFLGARTACVVALATGHRLVAERGDLPAALALGEPVTCRLLRGAVLPLEG